MEIEYWKDIEGFNGYQISSIGRVKSLGGKSNHKKDIILKQHIVMKYSVVALRNDNKQKLYKVHRLVANAFIPNKENKLQVNHIDGNKQNNCVSNLEWVTPHENIEHAYKLGLSKAKKGSENNRSISVRKLNPNTNEIIRTYASLHEMENAEGFCRKNITDAIKRNGTAYGWKWEYEN